MSAGATPRQDSHHNSQAVPPPSTPDDAFQNPGCSQAVPPTFVDPESPAWQSLRPHFPTSAFTIKETPDPNGLSGFVYRPLLREGDYATSKRQRVHEEPPMSQAQSGAPESKTAAQSQFGPFISAYGLMDLSSSRRPSGAPAESSSSGGGIPPFVVQAHLSPNYKSIILSTLPQEIQARFIVLPDMVQDTILKMTMVCKTCWENLPSVIIDVHSTWYAVWGAASLSLQNPKTLGVISLAVFIMKSGWGVPWVCLEKTLTMLNSQMRDVSFRIEVVWVYEDDKVGDAMNADIISNSPHRGNFRIMYMKTPADFATDLAARMLELRNLRWISLMSIPLSSDHEYHKANDQYPLHDNMNRCIWSWYKGLQYLARELGPTSGINILGSVPSFVPPALNQLTYHFGPVVMTNAANHKRANRVIQWFPSPSCTPDDTQRFQLHQHQFDVRAPLADGSCWVGGQNADANSGPLGNVPPMLSPAYPKLLLQMNAGQSHDVYSPSVMTDLTMKNSQTGVQEYAGVCFLLTHLGLEGSMLPSALNRYPCIGKFDMRDGHSQNAGAMFMTSCGTYMLCHNCRYIFENLACQWDVFGGVEIIGGAIVRAVNYWRKGEGPHTFMTFVARGHTCTNECKDDAITHEVGQPSQATARDTFASQR